MEQRMMFTLRRVGVPDRQVIFRLGVLLCAAVFVLTAALPLRGQTTATIFGTVTDGRQGAVRGARVTATNALTKQPILAIGAAK